MPVAICARGVCKMMKDTNTKNVLNISHLFTFPKPNLVDSAESKMVQCHLWIEASGCQPAGSAECELYRKRYCEKLTGLKDMLKFTTLQLLMFFFRYIRIMDTW